MAHNRGGRDPNANLRRQLAHVFAREGLAHSEELDAVIDVFLAADRHLSVTEAKEALERRGLHLDAEAIRDALDLLVSYGLATKRTFESAEPRYEHLHVGEHHDHFICTRCGKIMELRSDEIETLQNDLSQSMGFRPLSHKLELYGLCGDCCGPPSELIPLAMVPTGASVELVDVRGGFGVRHHLQRMGLRIGDQVNVVHNQGFGHMILAVGDTRLVLGQRMAEKLLVRAEEPPEED
ncbi:hypothetical protein AMJ39_07585 [candidate division TA06 bacterium DG_24]|jgi:Fur family ferric uptake transcriptional regulator|uniref:Ferrous iron transporter FeoA-like domain-containing protein n=3 Tax=Bacteria division TA06 TaxID=1156500 RepID=A0A0S8JM92_UNCT6|nr:MAG: hypothetical protein AMJ39_07585 [candidate division TA06 bacterium DG_24]KPK67624.1 MAG: hypothetical protein AMJ82_10240 [candidate division TA06 bacterium SM23_40]KPL10839.1 MAG: hypothetical protein AMJ71_01615 [candidate division TA06 bacterium SM1_40]